ncbi:hypothetical protein, partial [Parasedimentitalea psychrophila]|uniref:hypothetical protein n=1 Tax=Parasedimentitalea psychrophila TaxID=2997337 RepID=UPI0022EB59F9
QNLLMHSAEKILLPHPLSFGGDYLITSEKGICILQLLYIVRCDLSGYKIDNDRQIPKELQAYLSLRSAGLSEGLFSNSYGESDKRLIELGLVDD